MRIISTFNQTLYDTSGQWLLETIREHLDCELLVYTENMQPIPGVSCIDIQSVPEFSRVRQEQHEVILEDGHPDAQKLEGFNKRWFNWFRKIVAEHDAVIRHPYNGITIFLDSDIRIVRPFDDQVVRRLLTRPVGIFRGTREAVETGMVFYDETHPATKGFVGAYMNLFLTGEFRQFKRWDDSYTMSVTADRHPELVCDFAAGKEPVVHENSNGHRTSGHVLPITPWGEYMEHDKGIHWRKGVAADVRTRPGEAAAPTKAAVRAPWYRRLFQRQHTGSRQPQ